MFTVPELATLLRLGENAVYAMVAAGEIACLRVGPGKRSIRFTQAHVDDYLARAEASPPRPPQRRVRLKHLKSS